MLMHITLPKVVFIYSKRCFYILTFMCKAKEKKYILAVIIFMSSFSVSFNELSKHNIIYKHGCTSNKMICTCEHKINYMNDKL